MRLSGATKGWVEWILSAIAALCLISGCARPSTERQEAVADATARGVYQGVAVGFTAEGHPYRGDPEAPVTLEEYSDYLCPFCARHLEQTVPTLMEKYVSTGQVKYVFRDMPLASLHPTAPVGHAAALCVAEQGAALFWEMHDELFRAQSQWGALSDPSDVLAGIAKEVGADPAAYEACIAAGRHEGEIERGVAAGQALGFNGTPSFRFIHEESGETYTLVGAQPFDIFAQWLDALAAGEAPAQEEEAETEPPELPYWANAEGLAPDPDRPGYTMAGDPYKGNPEAKLVVVEFSDFQCPSCQRHALEAQPVLDETFVEMGEIMWVFKPLPLRIHPQSPAAAAAAECAGDQGRFWDMYHALFEAQEQWAVDDADPKLVRLAEGLRLDTDRFGACLKSREALERVLADLYDAQGVVSETPSFVILFGGQGRITRGARPVEQFVTTLEAMIESAKAQE
jgi:protein-disulfide isomerase